MSLMTQTTQCKKQLKCTTYTFYDGIGKPPTCTSINSSRHLSLDLTPSPASAIHISPMYSPLVRRLLSPPASHVYDNTMDLLCIFMLSQLSLVSEHGVLYFSYCLDRIQRQLGFNQGIPNALAPALTSLKIFNRLSIRNKPQLWEFFLALEILYMGKKSIFTSGYA